MSVHNTRSASQLRDFIDTNHIYVDGLDEDVIERIGEAAEKEPEEIFPSIVTKRKGKARRSLAPRFPSENNIPNIIDTQTPIYEEQRSLAGPSVSRLRPRLTESKLLSSC
ncbi:hypothetical protein OnM2_075060 [Erysiphe neolycopersici]|uniref:Uncharacterized protein n=1 Tax=Erysiphe neolycopersici TaxID=212602 RepID=A0A420HIT2_9PEZI|nr:hypothetical protein OnM2_075060 [Erysiphe neolycopersici]